MRITLLLLLLFSFSNFAATPFDQALTPGKVQRIEAHEPDGPIPQVTIFSRPNNPKRRKGFHYKLYLPQDYNDNPKKRYPVIFLQSSGGNANFMGFKKRIQNHDWIAVMLVEASNREPDSVNNFLAAHDDVMKRCRVAKGLKIVTGTSGGARNSSVYAILRPGVNAVLFQAAGFAYGFPDSINWKFMSNYPSHILLAVALGLGDYNRGELNRLYRETADQSRLELYSFKGGHVATPAHTVDQMLDWVEERLFFEEARAQDKSEFLSQAFPKLDYEWVDRYGYYWYFTSLKKRLENSTDDYQKYTLCRKLLGLAKRPELSRSAVVKKAMSEVARVARKLQKSEDIKKEYKRKKQWLKILDDEKALTSQIRQALNDGSITNTQKTLTSVPTVQFNPEPLSAIKEFKKTVDSFIKKSPDSFYSRALKHKLENWAYLYDLQDLLYKSQ